MGGYRFKNTQSSFTSNHEIIVSDSPFNESQRNYAGIKSIIFNYLPLKSEKLRDHNVHVIKINVDRKYQTWQGFGGAYTGATAFNMNLVNESLRKCIYKLYFSPKNGLGYTFVRWPIGGTDFDMTKWMYNEVPENDLKLTDLEKLHDSDVLKVSFEIMNLKLW